MKIKILSNYVKNNTFALFVLVGLLNTLFGYSLFALFVFLGMHYTLAVLLATCLGVLFNFKTTGKIVFKNSNNKLLFKFIIVYAVQYIFNISLIKLFLLISFNTYIAGALATIVCAFSAYLLNKNFVFTKVRVGT
jgi:putative flippase GtrA